MKPPPNSPMRVLPDEGGVSLFCPPCGWRWRPGRNPVQLDSLVDARDRHDSLAHPRPVEGWRLVLTRRGLAQSVSRVTVPFRMNQD